MTVTVTTTQIAAALRLRALSLSPADVGITDLTDPAQQVWGVVIETAHPDAVASLVVLADGSVSLYVSDGNGCIGAGSNREVRHSAADLLLVAEKTLPQATMTVDVDLPPEGFIRCYLLTHDGLRSMQMKLEDVNHVNTSIGVLYFAAQRVITAIERVGAGQSLAQEMKMAITAMERGTPLDQSGPSSPASLDDTQAALQFGSSGVTQCLSVGNVVLRLRT